MISEHASPLAVLGGDDAGGQNVYVAETAKSLADRGYLVDIYTRRESQTLPAMIKFYPGVKVYLIDAGPAVSVPKERIWGYMPAFYHEMLATIQQGIEPYELIHAHFWMSAWVGLRLKVTLKIPLVVTFHALGAVRKQHLQEKDEFPDERIGIEQQVVQQADRIIAECPQDEHDLITLYQADPLKLTTIPCGFSSAEFHPIDKKEARLKLEIDSDERILLQLGRMVARKGIDNVIKSLTYLPSTLTIRLIIVGGEKKHRLSYNAEYRRLVDLAKQTNLLSKIRFEGAINRKELKYYYAAADLFISTPWYEPFGITPLEAMACGTPVIGSAVGGIKYSVVQGETGVLVPPSDPQALAQAIQHLLYNEKLLHQMGENARHHVNTMFTWEKVVKDLIAVYTLCILNNTDPIVIAAEKKSLAG